MTQCMIVFDAQEFLITLQEPVPQPNKHEEKEWWHPECTRIAAEEMLKRIPTDGAFLVRPSGSNCYAISFRYISIKHLVFFLYNFL